MRFWEWKRNDLWPLVFSYCFGEKERWHYTSHKDAYPLPRIDDILDALQGAKYLYSIDLASGYWQIKVAEKDREKTAFGSHLGLYEFLCMPFGFTGAPVMFSRLVNKVLDGLIGKSCLVYLDDVIIYGKIWRNFG